VVAEKFEAMVKLGIANSRMKDFHDLRALSRLFSFDGPVLAEAIRRTFARRQSRLPAGATPPTAFTAEFFGDGSKRRQWDSFNLKNRLYVEPIPLNITIGDIERFLMPLLLGVKTDGRTKTAVGAVTAPIAGSFHVPTYLSSID
jgi:hypothetical protein